MSRIPIHEIAQLFTLTVRNWQADHAPRLGAALAFYMVLSMAPAVVIILAVTGMAFGAQAAEGRLIWQIQGLVGYEGAKVIQGMIEGAHRSKSGIVATLLGLGTLFFGATAVVIELKDALNTIWKVSDDVVCSTGRSIFNLAKQRLLGFALVLGAGLFLLASLIANAWLRATVQYLSLSPLPPSLIRTGEWLISFVMITILFALIFKFLPDVRLHWGDVAPGAVLTSLLFTAGQFLLAIYLANSGFANSYGAASSLVFLLVWVYYSAQVLFLGAEFTRAYALRFGSMFHAELDPSATTLEGCLWP